MMQSESNVLADKYKIEKEQNAQLRNQVAQLLKVEQEQKIQIQQQDSTIQTLQVGAVSIFFPHISLWYGCCSVSNLHSLQLYSY